MIIDIKGETFGLHPSLITPIAAKSKEAIIHYVGSIKQAYANDLAFLVSFEPLEKPNALEAWQYKRSIFISYPLQLWVHVNYLKYRILYKNIFSNVMEDPTHVIDHLMNRKLARNLGYNFVRLVHISRESNSSSGRGGETFANENLPIGLAINPDINTSDIVYADPMDLLKILNEKVGGFGLDAVRDKHYLFYG